MKLQKQVIQPCKCGNKATMQTAFDCGEQKDVFFVQCLMCKRKNEYEYDRREAVASWNKMQNPKELAK